MSRNRQREAHSSSQTCQNIEETGTSIRDLDPVRSKILNFHSARLVITAKLKTCG